MYQKRLPRNAKKVFSGILFDVYQWRQRLFDGTFTTFERLRRADTVQIIAAAGDKIVIQKQRQSGTEWFLSVPGGRVDAGETPQACARRELFEETGYASDDWKLLRTFSPTSHAMFSIYTYIARDCQKVKKPSPDAGEQIINRLISFEQFLKLSDDENFRNDDLVGYLLRCRLHPHRQEQLRKKIF